MLERGRPILAASRQLLAAGLDTPPYSPLPTVPDGIEHGIDIFGRITVALA